MGQLAEVLLRMEDQDIARKRLKHEKKTTRKRLKQAGEQFSANLAWEMNKFSQAAGTAESRFTRLLGFEKEKTAEASRQFGESLAVQERGITSRENIAGAELVERGAARQEQARQFDTKLESDQLLRNATIEFQKAQTALMNAQTDVALDEDLRRMKKEIVANEALMSKAKKDELLGHVNFLSTLSKSTDPKDKALLRAHHTQAVEAKLMAGEIEKLGLRYQNAAATNDILGTLLQAAKQESDMNARMLGVIADPGIGKFMSERMKDESAWDRLLFEKFGGYVGLPSGTEYQTPKGFLGLYGGEPQDVNLPTQEDVHNEATREVQEALDKLKR